MQMLNNKSVIIYSNATGSLSLWT